MVIMRARICVRSSIIVITTFAIVSVVVVGAAIIAVGLVVDTGGGALISISTMLSITSTKPRLSNDMQNRRDPRNNCDDDDYRRSFCQFCCRHHDDVQV